MLINHEVPLCLLEESLNFNDYDYALVHLFKDYPEYYNFFKRSVKMGRKVILDNSLFELEDTFDMNEFYYWVRELQPTEYIIPDTLEDCERTIEFIYEWCNNYKDVNGLSIGVIQGKTEEEVLFCYKKIEPLVNKVAISFDYSFYKDYFKNRGDLTEFEINSKGRQILLKKLKNQSFFNVNKPHHLLGCSTPQEFKEYRSYDWVDTVDTSNPIVHAIRNIKYSKKGLRYKEKIKLVDLFNISYKDIDMNILYNNIELFNMFCNGDNILDDNKRWVAFFSRTGSEIINLSKRLKRFPDLIITNKNYCDISEEFKNLFRGKIKLIPNIPSINDYDNILKSDDFITLHGYLKIIPSDICNKYNIYNLHPGLITKYPELKGKDPQDKVLKKIDNFKEIGCVIHKVISDVDSGKVLCTKSVTSFSKNNVYSKLQSIAVDLWVYFISRRF